MLLFTPCGFQSWLNESIIKSLVGKERKRMIECSRHIESKCGWIIEIGKTKWRSGPFNAFKCPHTISFLSNCLKSLYNSLYVLENMTVIVCVCFCVGMHVCAHTFCAHLCYKYQMWLTASSVWLWQLLFVVVDRLSVDGWRFQVSCLSLCDGCRALLWMWITVLLCPSLRIYV